MFMHWVLVLRYSKCRVLTCRRGYGDDLAGWGEGMRRGGGGVGGGGGDGEGITAGIKKLQGLFIHER